MLFPPVYATIEATLERMVARDMEEKTFKDADEAVRGPEAATAADPAEAPASVTEAAEVPAAEDTADIPDADQAPANLAVRDDLSPEGEDDETDEDAEDDEDVLEEDDGPKDPPWCDKVFGVRRLALYGICFGYGGGLIAAGLFSAVTGIEVTRSSFFGLGGAVIGYFIGNNLTKRLLAQAEAENPTDGSTPEQGDSVPDQKA